MKKIKTKEMVVASAIGAGYLVLGLAILWGVRFFNENSSEISVKQVKPGVECAAIVTTNGVAIDCWENEVVPE